MLLRLQAASQVWRISADIGLSTRVFEIDFCLIEGLAEQIVSLELHAHARRRADAEPIYPQGVTACDPVLRIKRQEFGQGLLLPVIEHIALKLRDDERQASDLGRKVAQFDASKIRQWNVRAAIRLAPPLVDLGLNRTHFFVGDNKEVTRAAG